MTKVIREACRLAKAEGLEVVEDYPTARHHVLVLANPHGQRMEYTVSQGGGGSPPVTQRRNMIASFRRFARGETHGLRLV